MKSPSTSQLPSVTLSPIEDEAMSTIHDPRSRRVSANMDDSSDSHSPTQHPDLNDEVATLSNKLINAINNQTALDDRLTATRQELETANNRIREIEAARVTERQSLQAKLNTETTARAEVETEKKKIEQELENLTTALFEEANRMVITAKEEAQQQQEVVQKKNDQLKAAARLGSSASVATRPAYRAQARAGVSELRARRPD